MDRTGKELKDEQEGFRVREKRRMNMTDSGLREEEDGQNGFRVSEEKNEQEGRVQGQGEEKNEYDGFSFKRGEGWIERVKS